MNPSKDQFTKAYEEHVDALFRFGLYKLGDHERVKDLVQETFVRTWSYLQGGKDIQQLRPFLYRTLSNLIIDEYRKKKTVSLEVLVEEGFDPVDSAAPEAGLQYDSERALRLVQSLPEAYRDAVYMRYVEGFSLEDIATITGETKNTVTVRVHRGIEKLRKLFEHET